MPREVLINDQNYTRFLQPYQPNAQGNHGLAPRDWNQNPYGSLYYAKPWNFPLIPRSEWQDRINDRTQRKAQLSDVRNRGMYGQPIPSRDQNGKGYCWAHSGVSAHLVARALMNEPYADLSAYAVACIIKGYRDEGGWGGDGVEFEATRGVPTSKFWPQQSMDKSNDNASTWADAAKHKYVEWYDLDPNAMLDQLMTALLSNMPVVSDFNWWSHSVATIDAVSWDGSQVTTRIWNSWGDSWSEKGTGKLEGQKAIPDAGLACRVVTPSLI